MKVVTMSEVPKRPATNPLLTGDVSSQAIFLPEDGKSFNFGIVHFSPGARTKFHIHSGDQILIITEGAGAITTDQEQHPVASGDVVLIAAGENHWHGAPGSTALSHITITSKDNVTTQTEP